MPDIIEEIVRLRERGERMALASLVWSTGSIPMSDRAKMITTEEGAIIGTIGGGCLEAEVLAVGKKVLDTGQNQHMQYTMTEKQAGESGLNCGGTVRIYSEVIEPDSAACPYDYVLRALVAREGGVLATLIDVERSESKGKMWVAIDGTQSGTLGTAGADDFVMRQLPVVLQQERGSIHELAIETGNVEIFIEPFLPVPVLYVFGGGHVGGQIGALAKNVGFRVVIIDDRPAFANPQRHPLADEWIVAEMNDGLNQLPIDEQSYVVAATRGHQHDEIVVEQAIKTSARYIGMLGSERKKLVLWKRIEERGGSREDLDRVFAPVGVNVGADTPEEIAVSVVAELIAVRRGTHKIWKTKTSKSNFSQR